MQYVRWMLEVYRNVYMYVQACGHTETNCREFKHDADQ